MADSNGRWQDDLYDLLRRNNITQFAYVPDAGHRILIDRSLADPGVHSIALTTEEEGVALMAGADLGGTRGVLLIQWSGAGNCVNMLSLMLGRGAGYPAPPPQIPACGFPAPGSCRRSNATEVRGLNGPGSSGPQARRFGDMPCPALGPEHALQLWVTTTGRLPSTPSAADVVGLVRGFIGSTQPSDSSCIPRWLRSTELPTPARNRLGGCGRQEVSQVPTRSFRA